MPTRRALLAAAVAAIASACTDGSSPAPGDTSSGPVESEDSPTSRAATSAAPSPSSADSPTSSTAPRVGPPQVITKGLEIPWGVAFLPDGAALVSERATARLLRISPDGDARELGAVPDVTADGEGGLLGIALSPSHADDHLVYAYHSTDRDNRVVRFTVDNDALGAPAAVLTGIATASNHNGGRIAFGPDGMLYVATGDAVDSDSAQDMNSLNGKILRITADGKPAPGNPTPTSAVYTYGHRNSEGLAWDRHGRLYESEFGASEFDEINLLKAGHNYGWPTVEGHDSENRFEQPLLTWPTQECSPSGIAYTPAGSGGALWVGALRGQRLWRVPVAADGSVGAPEGLFTNQFGRLRTVAVAGDGALWLTTSNRDGRGSPVADDDRIIRVPLA